MQHFAFELNCMLQYEYHISGGMCYEEKEKLDLSDGGSDDVAAGSFGGTGKKYRCDKENVIGYQDQEIC